MHSTLKLGGIMKKVQVQFIVLVFCVMGIAVASHAAKKTATGRLLSGKVTDHSGHPLPDAIVYLTDARTRAVKTYIVSSDGTYHFPALATNVDYEVYAQYKGKKSDTKTMSQFDDRPEISIELKINMK